jgi:rubrerythrin
MSEQPLTAAAIIRFSTDLEARSEAFYRALAALAERYPGQQATFARFAVDCAKSSTTVTRTYQETITDALEAGFSFEGIALSDYAADADLPEEISADALRPSQAIAQAIALEEKAIAFYQDVAEASESLLATIPRAFRRVARTRRRRLEQLRAL